jgi:hypothetical protein
MEAVKHSIDLTETKERILQHRKKTYLRLKN